MSLKKVRRTQIAHVDDTDFFSNGKDCVERIKIIINLYAKLYEATGAQVQEEKVKFYCWRHSMRDGRRVIEHIEAVISIHGKEIQQIDVHVSTRTLGVHVTPSLRCKTQFEKLRAKVVDAMGKIMRTSLAHQQAAVYYNMCMLTNVYFGCGIIKLHEREEIALRKFYEAPLLSKLGFNVNFPRYTMFVSK